MKKPKVKKPKPQDGGRFGLDAALYVIEEAKKLWASGAH